MIIVSKIIKLFPFSAKDDYLFFQPPAEKNSSALFFWKRKEATDYSIYFPLFESHEQKINLKKRE